MNGSSTAEKSSKKSRSVVRGIGDNDIDPTRGDWGFDGGAMKRAFGLAMMMTVSVPLALTVMARTGAAQQPAMPQTMDMHDHMAMDQQPAQGSYTPPKNDKIPPADPYVDDALKASPRHGEWIDVKLADGKMMRSWISYPVRSDKAPVVIVIFEIFGMNPWVQGVADQLAKDGFIAIAPDLLSGFAPNGGGSEELGRTGAQQIIGRVLPPDVRAARLDAVRSE